ncbi:MAG: oxidoreductase [Geminicoccaceae bacterium]|nr:oxidoreductase [Geminicoccaceae bacterium]MCX8101821.1 oxidoreductase [Geminicoccaceae bacterium]MDW8370713.1 MDR family oxidoreductase [Geminicoccaceae bacterium]
MAERFEALVLHQEDGRTVPRLESLSTDALPEGEVLLEVLCSTLNYKDALAITGAGKIVRSFPFVPGIDLVGRVVASSDPAWRPGELVLVTGWGMGERHWGGLAQKARLPAAWLQRLPEAMTPRRAMAIGTAGFTAMLCVMALEREGVRPGDGEVLVTGAAGGVGSIAVMLLARAGYRVVASTGKAESGPLLRELGAEQIVDRKSVAEPGAGPLASARWAGAVDTVGGPVLSGLLKAMRYRGTVAACGNAGGVELHTTVFPFILRGVRLIGIDSALAPMAEREAAWARLARDLDPDKLDRLTSVIGLEEVAAIAPRFLEGKVAGRIVVRIDPNA